MIPNIGDEIKRAKELFFGGFYIIIPTLKKVVQAFRQSSRLREIPLEFFRALDEVYAEQLAELDRQKQSKNEIQTIRPSK